MTKIELSPEQKRKAINIIASDAKSYAGTLDDLLNLINTEPEPQPTLLEEVEQAIRKTYIASQSEVDNWFSEAQAAIDKIREKARDRVAMDGHGTRYNNLSEDSKRNVNNDIDLVLEA